MRIQSGVVSLLCVLAVPGTATPVFGGDDVPDFPSLTGAELRTAVQEALAARLEAVQNLELVSWTEARQHEFADGAIGKPATPGTRGEFHLKRLNGSYWLSARLFSNERPSVPNIVSESNFDGDEGRSRGLMLENGGRTALFGRIDTKMDDSITINRAAYYITDWPNGEGMHFYRDILAEAGNWTVSSIPGKGEVVVSYPYRHRILSKHGLTGSCMVVFDAGRGMVPVRMKIDYRATADGQEIWRDETVSMEDVREVDGVWIPFKIQSLVRASSLKEGRCVLENTEVENASMGGVGEGDLVIDFPAGTFVTDAVQGVSYKVGADGKPVGKPTPFHNPEALPAAAASDKSGFTPRQVLLLVNVCLLGAAVIGFGFWRIRARRA